MHRYLKPSKSVKYVDSAYFSSGRYFSAELTTLLTLANLANLAIIFMFFIIGYIALYVCVYAVTYKQ